MTASPDLEATVDWGDAYHTVSLAGEIDYGNVSRLRSVLLDLVQQGTGDGVVDMSGVTFIDSTGLSVLVQAKQRFESAGREMSVVGIRPRVARVLELAGLNSYLVGG